MLSATVDDSVPKLGPCCVCETADGVTNIVMLHQRGPTPGRGWGCFQCGLPMDGALAVMCGACVERAPRFVCAGYAVEPGRVPVADLSPGAFDHDEAKHVD